MNKEDMRLEAELKALDNDPIAEHEWLCHPGSNFAVSIGCALTDCVVSARKKGNTHWKGAPDKQRIKRVVC